MATAPTAALAPTPDADALRRSLSTVEGRRRRKDVTMRVLVYTAFLLALIPLISLIWTVLANGIGRFNIYFLTHSMRNVFGGMDAGGVYHALIGPVLITLWATIISVPIGILAAVYLVEYGSGPLARAVTFFVDVMTGIPSIVAGLFAFSLFFLIIGGSNSRSGISGSVALSVLMIPVVIRSSEEMLRLVPNELREASLALGVPKWLTINKVVLRPRHRRDRAAAPGGGHDGLHQPERLQWQHDDVARVRLSAVRGRPGAMPGGSAQLHLDDQLRARLVRGADAHPRRHDPQPRGAAGQPALRPQDPGLTRQI